MKKLTKTMSLIGCFVITLVSAQISNAYSERVTVVNNSNSTYSVGSSSGICASSSGAVVPPGGSSTININVNDSSGACRGDREKFEKISIRGKSGSAQVQFQEQELGGFFEIGEANDPNDIIQVHGNTIQINQ